MKEGEILRAKLSPKFGECPFCGATDEPSGSNCLPCGLSAVMQIHGKLDDNFPQEYRIVTPCRYYNEVQILTAPLAFYDAKTGEKID